MTKYALVTAEGLPTLLGETETVPEGAVILPEGADMAVLMRQMMVEGVWQERPAVALTHAPGAPARVTLAVSSEAAIVRIFDLAAGEVLHEGTAGPGAFWEFPEAGLYGVEVEPPLPWMPAVLRVEVTA